MIKKQSIGFVRPEHVSLPLAATIPDKGEINRVLWNFCDTRREYSQVCLASWTESARSTQHFVFCTSTLTKPIHWSRGWIIAHSLFQAWEISLGSCAGGWRGHMKLCHVLRSQECFTLPPRFIYFDGGYISNCILSCVYIFQEWKRCRCMTLRCSCEYRYAHAMVYAWRSKDNLRCWPLSLTLFETELTEFHGCSLLCVGEGEFTSKNFPISASDLSVEVFDLQTCMSCLVFWGFWGLHSESLYFDRKSFIHRAISSAPWIISLALESWGLGEVIGAECFVVLKRLTWVWNWAEEFWRIVWCSLRCSWWKDQGEVGETDKDGGHHLGKLRTLVPKKWKLLKNVKQAHWKKHTDL